MSAPMKMLHATDPAAELRAAVGDVSAHELFANQILVAVYKRPEKTATGIYLSDSTRKEDDYQGKVGLVLKMGPQAFVSDSRVDFGDQRVEVGQWIVARPSDGWKLEINGQLCRMIEDTHVKMRVPAPDAVY